MSVKESRNIVLIIGNGFDLDIGLKTSYKDFWESEFCPKKYPAPLIHHLNQRWSNSLDAVRWYDLENELLNYYRSIPDPKHGADCLTEEESTFLKEFTSYGHACGWYADKEDLVQSLVDKGVLYYDGNVLGHISEHLKNDALKSPIWRDYKALQLIKDGLCKYLRSLDKHNKEFGKTTAGQLLYALSKAAQFGDYISIYTFNYTPIQFHGYPVHYMHGNCEEGRIIVGTRDDPEMEPCYDFLQKAMDDSFSPPDMVTALNEADEVIIFGHSLGENDRQYFAPFFHKQVDYENTLRKDIIIFTRDSDSEKEIKRALNKMTDGKLSALYSINHPIIIRTANINEDQQLMYDFLINHHEDTDFAEQFVGLLLTKHS